VGNHPGACPTGKIGQRGQSEEDSHSQLPQEPYGAHPAGAAAVAPAVGKRSGATPSACRRSRAKESAVVVLHTPAAQFSVSASIVHGEDVASLSALCNGMVGAGRSGSPLPCRANGHLQTGKARMVNL